jgi:hypothetical protein
MNLFAMKRLLESSRIRGPSFEYKLRLDPLPHRRLVETGSFSIATEQCWAIKEPMKSANLDDLGQAGLPEK